jgi:hypothetical protein
MDSWDFEEYSDKIDYYPKENSFFDAWIYEVNCKFGANMSEH